jgi:hypothetical protein
MLTCVWEFVNFVTSRNLLRMLLFVVIRLFLYWAYWIQTTRLTVSYTAQQKHCLNIAWTIISLCRYTRTVQSSASDCDDRAQ